MLSLSSPTFADSNSMRDVDNLPPQAPLISITTQRHSEREELFVIKKEEEKTWQWMKLALSM
jgi:hypothetical protein